MSNQALNLLKLAVQACRNKQYDSAGVLLANASCSSDVADFLELDMESDSFDGLDTESDVAESTASASEDSSFKRKRNSMHRISRMISAAAEAAEDDDEEADGFVEVDSDIPGEEAEPASFSGESESSETETFELEVSESSPIRAK